MIVFRASLLTIIVSLFVCSIANAKLVTEHSSLHNIDCGASFSCPDSIKGRISFWVDVFSKWDTDTAVFHDKEKPERVFSTVQRKEGCRRSKKGDSIDSQRKFLKKIINLTADKIAQGRTLSIDETKIANIFQGDSVSEMRRSSKRLRCQSGNSDRMKEALVNYELYRPTILKALASQNLSPELQYLPFVESAFNTRALSHVGAAGMWQIMPATGRTLGLTVNRSVDERYDPERATYAAAKYFRNSVDDLTETALKHGNRVTTKDLNPFVVTSYNYGVKGMMNAIEKVGLNYERLLAEYKSPNFQTAVKNFYSSFIAARHVAINTHSLDKNFASNSVSKLPRYNTVTLPNSISLNKFSSAVSVEKEKIKQFNPALNKRVWKNGRLIPAKYKLKLPYKESGWSAELARVAKVPREAQKRSYVWHKVRKGQTACGIARKYKTSCSRLRRENRLNRKGMVYVGQRLKISTRGNYAASSPSIRSSKSSSNRSKITYKVRSGDSACGIANRYGMACSTFLSLNNLSRKSTLRIGKRVKVYGAKKSSSNKWHTVRTGQTACVIAESYRIPCSTFLRANNLSKRSTIRIGQKLRVSMH